MPKSTKEYYRYLAVNPRDQAWGLSVTGAGYQPAAPGFDQVPKRHHPAGHFYVWEAGRVLSEYGVLYVTRGRGEFDSQGTGLIGLQAGDAVILLPGVWHRYRPHKDTGWGSYWLHFHGSTPDRLRTAGLLAPERAVVSVGLDEPLLQSFTTVLDGLRAESPGFAQIAAARTLEILARLTGAAGAERAVPRLQEIVRRARLALEENPAGLPVVEDLLRTFDISRTHFFRVFKEQTGQSPYKYHLQLTIRRAGTMLRDSDLSIKQIALTLGFRNPYHFSKLFKKKSGLSPRGYRQHWRHVSSHGA
ncbi:MAG: AraC family transcriptional regulator [Planctomycetota bacterium]